MMVFLIILAVIVLIALLRFGVALRYNEEGATVWLRVGFLSFKIYPAKKKRVKKRKMPDMKVLTELKPKSIEELKSLFSDPKGIVSRIKRRILIKRLEVEYTAAGNDPSSTAITFGKANALAGMVLTVLQNNFRIRHSEFNILADFESNQQKIRLDIVLTIAVWEVLYIVFSILPLITSSGDSIATKKNNINRKEINQNG